MRVVKWYNNRDIRIEEQDLPRPGPREITVKVHACGICGSDIVEWYRLPRAPLVQGHEIGAEVTEVGRDVTRFKPGDRVFIAPKASCGTCKYCRAGHFPQCSGIKERLPGGFAEYIHVPAALAEKAVYSLPDTISYEKSTFIEPLACVVRAQHLAGIRTGQTVLILGCGMSGLLQIQLAKKKGCRVAATDIDPEKLKRASVLGADVTITAAEDVPAKIVELTGGKADTVILCTSAMPAVAQAWAALDAGGVVVFFAVPGPDKTVTIPVAELWTREVRVITSYYCGPPDIEESMKLLETGKIAVESLVTHRLPLEETAAGFKLIMEGNRAIKVIIKPHGLSA
jgi:L-iditol 2-dehydrogenase